MKYSYLDNEILEAIEKQPRILYSELARDLKIKHADKDIAIGGLRKHISRIVNTQLQVTKQVLDKNGNVIKEIKSLRNSEIKEIPDGFEPKKIVSLGYGTQNVTYEKQKVNNFTLIQESIERLSKTILSIPKLKRKRTPKTNNFTLCIYTGDKHIGSAQDETDLYKKSLSHQEKMYNVLCEVLKLQKIYGTFEKCYYFDLGDALDGFNKKTTRGGHELQQDLDNRQQFDTLVENELKFINSLIQHNIANDFKFIATTNDNHSGDFSYFAWRLIYDYVKHVYEYDTHINTKFLGVEKIGKHDIIYTHGKDVKYKKNGLPLNLDNKTEIFIKEFIMDRGLNFSRFVKADLHQSGFNRGKWFDYINIASMIGNTTYTTTNYGNNYAGCYFEIFDKNIRDYTSKHFFI